MAGTARVGSTEIVGLRETLRGLKQLGANVQDLKAVMVPIAETIAAEVRPRVPVRTGALVGSLKVAKSATKLQVRLGGPRIGYAHVIEFGSRHMRARPMLRPTLDAGADKYAAQLDQALTDLLHRLQLAP